MGDPGSLVTEGRAGERSWCLRRVGMNTEWLLLEDGNEVSGRGLLEAREGVWRRLGTQGGLVSGREG